MNARKTGLLGEEAAASLLRSWFRDVDTSGWPGKDGGVDLKCAKWLISTPDYESPVEYWVQVKAGPSWYNGIRVRRSTFNFWIEYIESHPLLIFHYPDTVNCPKFPEYVLVLHRWVLENLSKLRDKLKRDNPIFIPHSAFTQAAGARRIRELFLEEQSRVSFRMRSHFGVRKDAYYREYHYIHSFPTVARNWEERELGFRNDGFEDIDICKELNVMDQHPVDRVPGTYLERAQQQLYRALMSNPSETGWRLSWRFNAWSVAAARAMAWKYDGFIPHVAEVLRTWRDRPITDVLVALQMLAIQG